MSLEASEGTRYGKDKISEKLAAGKKQDCVDLAFELHKGFTAQSVLIFFCIRLVIYGEHRVNYDIRHCWSPSPTRGIGLLNTGQLMPLNYFLAHSRYLHFEDNGKDNDLDPKTGKPIDRQWKTREIREQFLSNNLDLYFVGEDLCIDEKVCQAAPPLSLHHPHASPWTLDRCAIPVRRKYTIGYAVGLNRVRTKGAPVTAR